MGSRPTKHRSKWRIRWLDADGGRQSKVFNTYRDAERALALLKTEADQIREGLKARPLPEHTFGDACDYWLEHRAARKKSSKDDTSIIDRHLRPVFGSLKLQELSLEHVDAFRRNICPDERDRGGRSAGRPAEGKVTPKTLHNILTLQISILNLAVDLRWIQSRPAIKKPRLLRGEFSYLRTSADAEKFLKSAREEEEGAYELYYVALHTGARAGELLGLQWADIDLGRRLITIQRSYASSTKTDEIRHIPILDALLPFLRGWRLRCPSAVWVFPSKVGTMQQPSARVLQETFKRVLRRSGLPYPLRFHDLRHSFASAWMMRNGNLFRLQKILGHKSVTMTERYAHLSPDIWAEDYSIFETPRVAQEPEMGKVLRPSRFASVSPEPDHRDK